MANISKIESNFSNENIKKTYCMSEACQPNSSHPGIVLPAILTPKEYKPLSK